CHIGPALDVQGGISSVLVSYKKLFKLPDENFMPSYNGSFVKSLPLFFCLCLKLLFCPPDVPYFQIHTSFNGSFFRKFLISLCLRLRRKKYVVHVHGSRFIRMCETSPKLVQRFIRCYFRHSVMVVCITPDMQEFLDDFVGKGKCRYVVIPNPCSTIADVPVDLTLHEKPVKIVFSGRYGQRKGVYDLVKAFSNANFKNPVELYLFGDGEVEKLKSVVADSPKAEMIHVSDWLKHEEYLKTLVQFDLLALPSYAETFGMSLVEAMGLGIPVVAARSGGVPYVVRDGVDGFLMDAGDIQMLSKNLETLVDDTSLRVRMGHDAWMDAVKNYKSDVVLDKLENAYKGMNG
ncbi:MAG: glycosyltransferase family 4 protein, partial [Fibrobacter sp.]|nr:glycosyltransferase family 4 protein [Fibrobacter sp.]MBR6124477.1 glycosyltransferase family 4 protein [Candidatus Saccharibacteria bacterium]